VRDGQQAPAADIPDDVHQYLDAFDRLKQDWQEQKGACQANIQQLLQTLTTYQKISKPDAVALNSLQSSLASKSDRAKQLQSSVVRPCMCC
jgi:DNA-binding protein H-NS